MLIMNILRSYLPLNLRQSSKIEMKQMELTLSFRWFWTLAVKKVTTWLIYYHQQGHKFKTKHNPAFLLKWTHKYEINKKNFIQDVSWHREIADQWLSSHLKESYPTRFFFLQYYLYRRIICCANHKAY